MTEKLLNCPMCGSKAHLIHSNNCEVLNYTISCDSISCGVHTHASLCENYVIDTWNSRQHIIQFSLDEQISEIMKSTVPAIIDASRSLARKETKELLAKRHAQDEKIAYALQETASIILKEVRKYTKC